MVPSGRRELAWRIPYLEVRTVSWSKRRLQSNAMPFRGQSHCHGRCEFSSGATVAL
jgi:hypothetical protein